MARQPEYLRNLGVTQVPLVPTSSGAPMAGIMGRTLDPRHMTLMVRNIESIFHHANAQQLQEGLHWYMHANEIAHEIGNGDIRKGAGIISALSPKRPWENNVKLARKFGKTGAMSGAPQADLRKAQRIREGEDPENVLPMRKKTGHFYRNILDPHDPNFVSIDAHAHDLAMGRKPLYDTNRGLDDAPRRYDTFVHAYSTAARRLGVEVPSQVQAVTWLHWRDLKHPVGGSSNAL